MCEGKNNLLQESTEKLEELIKHVEKMLRKRKIERPHDFLHSQPLQQKDTVVQQH
ncbi:MAG: hypothetical protein K9L56_15795 [Clostridiales bacterium]|nr:hypothetical protein [Clostridiales bacterium]